MSIDYDDEDFGLNAPISRVIARWIFILQTLFVVLWIGLTLEALSFDVGDLAEVVKGRVLPDSYGRGSSFSPTQLLLALQGLCVTGAIILQYLFWAAYGWDVKRRTRGRVNHLERLKLVYLVMAGITVVSGVLAGVSALVEGEPLGAIIMLVILLGVGFLWFVIARKVGRGEGRILATVLAVLSLPNCFPGAFVGVYALWVLWMNRESKAAFDGKRWDAVVDDMGPQDEDPQSAGSSDDGSGAEAIRRLGLEDD